MTPAAAVDNKQRSSIDEILDQFKKDIDITLIEENLKLTTDQRLAKLQSFVDFVEEARAAVKRTRGPE